MTAVGFDDRDIAPFCKWCARFNCRVGGWLLAGSPARSGIVTVVERVPHARPPAARARRHVEAVVVRGEVAEGVLDLRFGEARRAVALGLVVADGDRHSNWRWDYIRPRPPEYCHRSTYKREKRCVSDPRFRT
eukprot:gene5534-biopygen8326